MRFAVLLVVVVVLLVSNHFVHVTSQDEEKESYINEGCGLSSGAAVQSREQAAGSHSRVSLGDVPWIAAIFTEEQDGDDWIEVLAGGGSVVHPRAVLTAAHLLTGLTPDRVNVVTGITQIDDKMESTRQQRTVVKIHVHPSYNSRMEHFDVALLELNETLQTTDAVATVCLPDKDETFYNSTCTTTGWSKTEFNGLEQSQSLRRVALPLVRRRKCERLLRRTRLGRRFELHDSFMCAGGKEGTGTYQGDGGGPLVCLVCQNVEDCNYVQVGVVSWGLEQSLSSTPEIYADVARMNRWIKSQLRKLND